MKRTTLLAAAGGAVAAAAVTLAVAVPAFAAPTPTPTPTPPGDSATPTPGTPDGTAPERCGPAGDGAGRGPGGPGERPAGEPVTVESTVESTTTGPDGAVTGLVLADGTQVRVRPGTDLAAYPAGTPLRVEGERHTGPDGDAHVHPTTITNTATGESVTVGR